MPLWDTKQRQGHSLHYICAYQGSFPPQLPAYFLDRFSDAKVVMDPFCGRGTVLLEAVLRGKLAQGYDLLPVAQTLSRAKVSCPPLQEVLDEIDALDLSGPAPEVPPKFVDLYHPKTWAELWNLRSAPRSDILTALTLGRLHGHSPGFFSSCTFNVVSLRPPSLAKQRAKYLAKGDPKAQLEYRDVKALLRKAAKRFIPEEGVTGLGDVQEYDARALPDPDGVVDLVITSPPFLDVIDYNDVNWVRQWFLGAEDSPIGVFKDRSDYITFLRGVLKELHRVLSPNGTIVFEVGPVKKESRMVALVAEAAKGVFEYSGLAVNDFTGADVPKISRAMRGDGGKTSTMANHCVIFAKTREALGGFDPIPEDMVTIREKPKRAPKSKPFTTPEWALKRLFEAVEFADGEWLCPDADIGMLHAIRTLKPNVKIDATTRNDKPTLVPFVADRTKMFVLDFEQQASLRLPSISDGVAPYKVAIVANAPSSEYLDKMAEFADHVVLLGSLASPRLDDAQTLVLPDPVKGIQGDAAWFVRSRQNPSGNVMLLARTPAKERKAVGTADRMLKEGWALYESRNSANGVDLSDTVKRAAENLKAHLVREIVSVQPMTAPTKTLFNVVYFPKESPSVQEVDSGGAEVADRSQGPDAEAASDAPTGGAVRDPQDS